MLSEPSPVKTRAEEIRGAVAAQLSARTANWSSELPERKLKELEFHDKERPLADPPADMKEFAEGLVENLPNTRFYATARASEIFVNDWLKRHAAGRVVLDYACGVGTHT